VNKWIFIFGSPRSGTTYTGNLFGNIDNSVVIPEAQFLVKFIKYVDGEGIVHNRDRLYHDIKNDFSFVAWSIDINEVVKQCSNIKELKFHKLFTEFAISYCRKNNIYFDKNTIFIDHTPESFKSFDKLSYLATGIYFYHLVRDGRAVSASVLDCDFGIVLPEQAGLYWARHLAGGLLCESLAPESIRRIRYEDVLTWDQNALSQVLKGVTDKPVTDINYDNFAPSRYTRSTHKLVPQAPDPQRCDAWKDELTARQIQLVESTCGELLSLLGYEPMYWPDITGRSTIEHLTKLVEEPVGKLLQKISTARRRSLVDR